MQGLDGAVLARLRDAGPQTKSQLAEALGVPRTTLSATVRALAGAGLVEDGALAPSSGGRRSVSIRIPAARVFAAVSVGDRRVRVAVLGGHLTIAAGVSIDRREHDGDDAVAARVLGTARELLDDRAPSAIGVAAVDLESVLAGELLRRLREEHPGTALTTLPAVRAMALGERHSGAARGMADLVAVRLGDGVTTATIAGGHLGEGATGRAGDVGHLRVEEFGPACACGRTGCLDSYASAVALVAQATDLAHRGRSRHLAAVLDRGAALGLGDVVAAAEAGEPAVVQLARDAGQRLGQVVAGVVAHANPRCVVLGGPVAALGPHLLGDVRAAAYRLAPARSAENLDIVLSELGERAVLVGTGYGAVGAWITTATSG